MLVVEGKSTEKHTVLISQLQMHQSVQSRPEVFHLKHLVIKK